MVHEVVRDLEVQWVYQDLLEILEIEVQMAHQEDL